MIRQKSPIVKIWLFLTFISLLPLLIVFKSDHYSFAKKTMSEVALLELNDFRYKEISAVGVGIEVLGVLGYHFADKDITKNFKILQKDGDKDIVIFAKDAVKIGDITHLSGDVTYQRSDGYKLIAQKARYFEKAQKVKIDSEFRFDGDKFTAFGSTSDIDLRNKTIGVESIRAKIITNN